MDEGAWRKLADDLRRLYDNDCRVLSEEWIARLGEMLRIPDKKIAARRIAIYLANSPLEGDLETQIAHRIGDILGLHVNHDAPREIEIYEINQWVAAPDTLTMGRLVS